MINLIKKIEKKPRRFLRGKKGFSLAETLVALIIVSLLTMCLATGTAFGIQQYRRAVTRSEARILCSTLSTVLSEELSNAQNVTVSGGKVTEYGSLRYGPVSLNTKDVHGNALSDGEAGFLYAGSSELLGKAAYSKGYQELGVKVPDVSFDAAANRFTVTLTVTDTGGSQQVETTFDVIPLKKLT